jgi:hypothetical protein
MPTKNLWKSKLCKRRSDKTKATFEILPSQEQAENTEWKYWHRWERFLDVLQAENEPTLYIVGDSIWVEEVENAITTFKPEIIVTNSGGAIIPGFENNQF